MTDKQENKRSMYLAVKETVDNFNTAWAGLPAFVTAYGLYTTRLTELNDVRLQQEKATEGVTKDKAEAKEDAIAKAIVVSSAVSAFASVTENETLRGIVDYSQTDMDRSRDTLLIDILRVIYNAANDNAAALVDYGIAATDFGEFEGLIDTYESVVQSPRTAIGEGAAATEYLVEVIAAIDNILKNQMDKLVEVLKNAEGEFYAKYEKARIIVDLRSGGPADTDPDAPPATE